ncbi:MAG: lytic transglycosylase domain-containing protein [Thermodesulfobacteriota bacterium]
MRIPGRQIWLLPLLLLPLIILLGAGHGECSLKKYVDKYSKSTISQQRLDRVSRYNDLIDYYCRFTFFRPKHRVSPDFIKALILAESDGNPRAVSHKRAMGLGQIILTTGQEAGRELARRHIDFQHVSRSTLKNITAKDLFDPAVNILLTCYLISKYNHKFNGRLDLVLTAWNAGENTRQLRWGRPAPYRETLNLIGKVNGYYLFLLKQKQLRKQKRIAFRRM